MEGRRSLGGVGAHRPSPTEDRGQLPGGFDEDGGHRVASRFRSPAHGQTAARSQKRSRDLAGCVSLVRERDAEAMLKSRSSEVSPPKFKAYQMNSPGSIVVQN